jgi:hypothetical protein
MASHALRVHRVIPRFASRHLAIALLCGGIAACGSDSETSFHSSATTKTDSGGPGSADSGLSDGSTTEGDASTSGDARKPGAGGSTVGAGGASAGGTSQRDAQVIDAPSADGRADDAGRAADGSAGGQAGANTGGAPQDGGAGGCTARTVFYVDGDGDGYGRAAGATVACKKPATGKWAVHDGDCNDSDPNVHPNQTTYFGKPYKLSNGADSFDYDCSGMEDPNLSLPIAPANCGLLSLTLCGGSGYAQTTRTGPGVNPLCGSTVKSTCQAALGILACQTVTETVTEPFGCR